MARGRKTIYGAPAQPVAVGPSQQYGEGVALAKAQAAVPLPASPPTPLPPPGSLGPLTAPTARPGEHIMTQPSNVPQPTAGPNLNAIDDQIFAQWLPLLELQASQPGSSQAVRSMVRQLRAQMPDNLDLSKFYGGSNGR